MALTSPSIRRLNNTVVIKKSGEAEIIKRDLPEHIAAFLASGGTVDVIPGFTEIAPRPPCRESVAAPRVPRKPPVQALPGDTADWRTIPEFPKYAVTMDERVKSRRSGVLIRGKTVGRVTITDMDGLPRDVPRKALVKAAWGDK